MYSNTSKTRQTSLRDQVLQSARAAKRGLDEIIRPLAIAKNAPAVDDPHYWDEVWKTAHFLRLQADALSVRAQQQGKRLREAAHPANRPGVIPRNKDGRWTPSWELSEPKGEDS